MWPGSAGGEGCPCHRNFLPFLPPGSLLGCAGCATWFVRGLSEEEKILWKLMGEHKGMLLVPY